MNNALYGNGTVTKLGASDLTITNTEGSDGTRFTGLFDVEAGKLTVNALAQSTSGEFDYSALVDNGSTLSYVANSGDLYNINNASKFEFGTTAANSTISFTNASYNLTGDLTNAAGNNISFNDADLTVLGNASFAGNYILNNSSLDLRDSTVSNVLFAGLTSDSSSMDIDFSFAGTGSADKIISTVSSGTISLNNINVFNLEDSGNNLERNIQVLEGLTFKDSGTYSSVLESDLYKYTVNIVNGNTLHMIASDYNADTLYILNHIKDNNRTFTLVKDDVYYTGRDLDKTLSGTLTLAGRTGKNDTIMAQTSSSDSTKHSMFELVNDGTTLNVDKFSILNASTSSNGSVVKATASDAKIHITSSKLQNNTSVSEGGAIYMAGGELSSSASQYSNNTGNNGGVLYITNASVTSEGDLFTGNTATANGGAIYNAVDGQVAIYNASFSTNSALNGGALYNAASGELGENIIFTGNTATANGGAIYNTNTLTIGSGTQFTNNNATEGSAIYNLANAEITNAVFTGNGGNSYIYNGSDGILTLNAQSAVALSLNNGTSAIINNNGELRLNAKDTSSIAINDEINTALSNKGTISTNGTVALNNLVSNQNLKVQTGTLTLGIAGSTVANILNNVDLEIAAGTSATVNNKNIVGGTINNLNELNIVNADATSISAQLLGSGNINKSGAGKLSVTGDNDNSAFSGDININAGTVAFDTTGSNFISANSNINIKNGSTFEYISKDNEYTFSDATFANVNLVGEGNNVVIAGLGSGNSKYVINSDWITTNANTNSLIFKDSDYVLNTTFEKSSGSADNLSFDSAVISLGDLIPTTDSTTYSGVKDYNMGTNNYKLTNSTLDLSNNIAGNDYKFSVLNLAGDNNKISLDVNLYLDETSGTMPYADTITADSGDGCKNYQVICNQ